jgi:hypothetical protein
MAFGRHLGFALDQASAAVKAIENRFQTVICILESSLLSKIWMEISLR